MWLALIVLVLLVAVVSYVIRRLAVGSDIRPSSGLEGAIEFKGETYTFPLPRETKRRPDIKDIQVYVTPATRKELNDYYFKVLPASGWQFSDRLATGFFFTRGTVRLTIVETWEPSEAITRLRMTVSRRERASETGP